jgi:hypothetical protein
MTHLKINKPPAFFFGSDDCPNLFVSCEEEKGKRHIHFSMEMSRSYTMDKQQAESFKNWLIWAESWVSDNM